MPFAPLDKRKSAARPQRKAAMPDAPVHKGAAPGTPLFLRRADSNDTAGENSEFESNQSSASQAAAPPTANPPGESQDRVFGAAERGISGPSRPLPHLDRIQKAFGPDHPLDDVQAHIGGPAAEANRSLKSEGFAMGTHVAFPSQPGLGLAAHEAAHVVQQRAGVHLSGGVGQPGDVFERHANAVAQRVEAGISAAPLLTPAAGGAGTAPMLQRQTPDPATPKADPNVPTVQSPKHLPTDDEKKRWTDAGGDKMIAAVKADLARWEAFRKWPASRKSLPGAAAKAAIDEFAAAAGAQMGLDAWVPFYSSSQLGGRNLALLTEMVSINIIFTDDIGKVFNVAKVPAQHKYTLHLSAASSMLEKGRAMVVPKVVIEYENRFGMKWSRNYYLLGLQVGLSAGAEVDKEGKPKVNPPSIGPGPISMSLDGTSVADPTPIFFGPDDLSGTPFGKVGGPSGGATAGRGGSFETGLGLKFGSDPSLTFNAFHGATTSSSKGKVKFSIGLVDVAGGLSVGGNEKSASASDYEPQVVHDTRQWTAFWMYPTGDAILPSVGLDRIFALKKSIRTEFAQLGIEKGEEILKKNGIDLQRAMALHWELVGRASRSWKAARSDPQRISENQALATRRASNAAPYVERALQDLPGTLKCDGVSGAGPGTLGKSYQGEAPVILSDPSAQETYILEKQKVNQQYDDLLKEAQSDPNPASRRARIADIESSRKAELAGIEANLGPQSNVDEARRAELTVTWDGYRVAEELPGAQVKT